MIIRRRHWVLAAVLFVVGPLLGLAIGALVGAYSGDGDGCQVNLDGYTSSKALENSPQVTLPNGEEISVREIAPGRTTAIVVMKDARCPVCQLQLRALSDRLHEVELTGGTVVGLSDADPCTNRRLMQKLGLRYPVVSDEDHELLEMLEMDLPDRPHVMPGVVILDEDGRVETVYRGRKPGDRQEDMILERLRRR